MFSGNSKKANLALLGIVLSIIFVYLLIQPLVQADDWGNGNGNGGNGGNGDGGNGGNGEDDWGEDEDQDEEIGEGDEVTVQEEEWCTENPTECEEDTQWCMDTPDCIYITPDGTGLLCADPGSCEVEVRPDGTVIITGPTQPADGDGFNGGNGFEPDCDRSNRCRNNDVWKWDSCDGWLYKVNECGSTSWGSWSDWSCKNPHKKKRSRTRNNCSGGSCGTQTQEDTVDCVHDCDSGKCQPQASFSMSPNPANEGDTITLNASNSEDSYGGNNLAYEWFYDGSPIGTGKTLTYTIPSASTHQIKLKVTSTGMPSHSEDNGTTDETTQNLSVNNAPTPVINAPNECTVPCTANIDAVGTTDDQDPANQLTYEWDYENNGTIDETFNDPNMPGTHLFNEWKAYDVRLKVTDTDGLWAETVHTIDVQNNPPNADFKMIPTPATGIIPLTVEFINQTTDPDGHTLTYEWDFGTGDTNTETNPTYIYDYEGTYGATLTATDQYGATNTQTKNITPKQPAAITTLTGTNGQINKNPTSIITITCNKTVNAKIELLNENGTQIPNMNPTHYNIICDETPTPGIQTQSFPEPGAYQIKATIPTEKCTNCPKTKYIIIARKVKTTKTPDLPAILAIAIALTVLLVIKRKKA